MTNIDKARTEGIPDDAETQSKLIIEALVEAAYWLKEIADAARDIHAVLESIARRTK